MLCTTTAESYLPLSSAVLEDPGTCLVAILLTTNSQHNRQTKGPTRGDRREGECCVY